MVVRSSICREGSWWGLCRGLGYLFVRLFYKNLFCFECFGWISFGD